MNDMPGSRAGGGGVSWYVGGVEGGVGKVHRQQGEAESAETSTGETRRAPDFARHGEEGQDSKREEVHRCDGRGRPCARMEGPNPL